MPRRDDAQQFQYKLVVVVRSDLRLSPGKLAVQVGHAAVSCALRAKEHAPDRFHNWYREGQKKVVVKVQGLDDLLRLNEEAGRKGLTAVLIQDAGLTEVPPGTTTCLGVGPGSDAQVDGVTGSLSLL